MLNFPPGNTTPIFHRLRSIENIDDRLVAYTISQNGIDHPNATIVSVYTDYRTGQLEFEFENEERRTGWVREYNSDDIVVICRQPTNET